jgi:hypothetical protein
MAFNFENFLADHQFSNWISDLTEVLDGEADGIPARLQLFREKFKIAPQRQEAEPFRFNLAQRSYETIPAEVLQAGRNLKKCTYVQGDRFFVSRNFQEEPIVDGVNQVWEEVASPSSVDIHAESAQLSFLDNEKKLVDWPLTLANLNRMIQNKPYSENMMRSCLLRMINHYEPRQTEYLKNKTSNEIARFLLSLDSRMDRASFHRAKLHQSVREVNETLSSAVMKVKNIVDQIYPLPVPPVAAPQAAAGGDGGQPGQAQVQPPQEDVIREHDSNSIANRILIHAIISFVNDELALPLMAKAQQDNVQSRLMSYQVYLNLAMNAELRSNSYPKVALKYGRKISPKFANMTLNNIEVPFIHPSMNIPRKKGYFPRDMSNMFQTFPSQETDRIENNIQNLYANQDAFNAEDLANWYGIVPPHLVDENGVEVGIPLQPNVVNQPLPRVVKPPSAEPEKKKIAQSSGDNQQPGPSGLKKVLPTSTKEFVKIKDVPSGAIIYSSKKNGNAYFKVGNEKFYVDPTDSQISSDDDSPENLPTTSGEEGDSSSTEMYKEIQNMSIMLDKVLKNIRFTDQSSKKDQQKNPENEKNRSRPISKEKVHNDYKGNQNKAQPTHYPRDNSRENYRSNRNRSYERNRSNERDFKNDYNRSRYNRSQSRERQYSGNRDFSGNRDYRDRQRYPSRDRSGSRYDRQRYPSRDRQRYPSRDRSGYSNMNRARSRERSPYFNSRRDVSRDRSRESRRYQNLVATNSKFYPHMRRGQNCSENYNPTVNKHCSKCKNESSHHEFECNIYDAWNEKKCMICEKYNHFARDCKEVPKFPPKSADSNSTLCPN